MQYSSVSPKDMQSETASLDRGRTAAQGNAALGFCARFRIFDCLIIGTLLIAGWRYTAGLQQLIDIKLWDDSLYLTNGVNFFLNSTWPNAQQAPLYSVWHSFLVRFSQDAEALYFLNYRLVMIIPPVLLYILLRRLSVSLLAASFMALLLLVSSENYNLFPRVNHFGLIILLIFFILATIPKDLTKSLVILAFGFLLASYVRPEMYVAFITCSIAAMTVFYFRERTRSNLLSIGALVIAGIAAALAVGQPQQGSRDYIAFGQHFAVNWVGWNQDSGLNPWYDTRLIMTSNFGQANSIVEAAWSNPSAFSHHLLTNLVALPKQIIKMFNVNPAIPSALHVPADLVNGLLGIIAAASIIAGLRALSRRKNKLGQRERRFLLHSACTSALIITSCLLIYPRDHYVFVLAALLLAVFGVLLDPFRENQKLGRRAQAVAAICAAVAIFAVTPVVGQYGPKPAYRPNSAAIEFIKSIDVTSEVRLFSREGGLITYLADEWGAPKCTVQTCGTWKWMGVSRKGGDETDPRKAIPFDKFRRDNGINMILVQKGLVEDSRMRDDPEWREFLENPQRAGFEKLISPDGTQTLYAAKNILGSTS